jgi:hypothetical protein
MPTPDPFNSAHAMNTEEAHQKPISTRSEQGSDSYVACLILCFLGVTLAVFIGVVFS